MTTIAILRPTDRQEESEELARKMGFDTVFASPIDLKTNDTPEFVTFLQGLEYGDVDIVVLTSSTAVKSTFELAQKHGRSEELSRGLRQAQVIAIGSLTARAAEKEWIKVDILPEKFTSEGLVHLLAKKGVDGKQAVVLRSDQCSDVLVNGMESSGATVKEIAVYKLTKVKTGRPLLDMFYKGIRGEIDVFAFTSSMSAKSFIDEARKHYSDDEVDDMLDCAVIAAIGEPTKKTLEDMGVRVDIMPEKATFEDLLQAVENAIREGTVYSSARSLK
jgi:uroporphyrinogen-III synthase